MDRQRNAPCACGSGKKFKRCCLDAIVAWQRAGKGIVAAYVELEDGSRRPLNEWKGPIDAETALVTEINPITMAWARNTLPHGARSDDPAYRGMLLEHLGVLVGDRVDPSLAAELHARG